MNASTLNKLKWIYRYIYVYDKMVAKTYVNETCMLGNITRT